MQQEKFITLAKRGTVPEMNLYTETYSSGDQSTKKDVMLFIPGGPGNDHSLYNDNSCSMVNAFSPYVDIILFDPRSCGKSDKTDLHYCSLTHYIDDIEAIRQHFHIAPKHFCNYSPNSNES